MVIYLKRNNLRNLFCLLLGVLSLYLLDNTKLNKYIGYDKVKEYIKKDIDVFALGKGFFGDKILNLYNADISVSNSVIKEEKIGNLTVVYQSDNYLYSTYIGSVIKIDKNKDSYSIIISKTGGKILISNLKEVYVSLYQKIEADTLLALIDGYYFYEEI